MVKSKQHDTDVQLTKGLRPMMKNTHVIIGLTGSIATGKSTVSQYLSQKGVPVFCADSEVHTLQTQDKQTIKAMTMRFPEVVVRGLIDRQKLLTLVAADVQARLDLEAIIHPRVRARMDAWLEQHKQSPIRVIDVPLLFEVGHDRLCDETWLVYCHPEVQIQRLRARNSDWSDDQIAGLMAGQKPIEEKCARATRIIDNNGPIDVTYFQIDRLLSYVAPYFKPKGAKPVAVGGSAKPKKTLVKRLVEAVKKRSAERAAKKLAKKAKVTKKLSATRKKK